MTSHERRLDVRKSSAFFSFDHTCSAYCANNLWFTNPFSCTTDSIHSSEEFAEKSWMLVLHAASDKTTRIWSFNQILIYHTDRFASVTSVVDFSNTQNKPIYHTNLFRNWRSLSVPLQVNTPGSLRDRTCQLSGCNYWQILLFSFAGSIATRLLTLASDR